MPPLSLRALLMCALIQVSSAFVVQQPQQQHQVLRPLLQPTTSALTQHHLLASTNKHSCTALSLLPDTNSLLMAEQSLSLRNTDVWVFIVGIIPFAWATVEFWRRIAVGEPFGTGKDSVYIGKDNAPEESRGRRVLDRGAFLAAYLLFGIAAAAIGITLFSVVTSPPMDSLPPQ